MRKRRNVRYLDGDGKPCHTISQNPLIFGLKIHVRNY